MKSWPFLIALGLCFGVNASVAIERTPGDPYRWTVVLVKGVAERLSAQGTHQKLKEGQEVNPGDEIRIGKDAQLVVRSGDGVLIRPGEDSRVRWIQTQSPEGGRRGIKLVNGRVILQLGKDFAGSGFLVEAGALSTYVDGGLTEWNLVGEDLEAAVHDGSLTFKSNGQVEKLSAGSFASFRGGWLRLRRRLDRSEKERFEHWGLLREELKQKIESNAAKKTTSAKKR